MMVDRQAICGEEFHPCGCCKHCFDDCTPYLNGEIEDEDDEE